jgi:hypothetical protein
MAITEEKARFDTKLPKEQKLLLIDALKRSFEIGRTIGSYAVVVDHLDKDAESFYEKYVLFCCR